MAIIRGTAGNDRLSGTASDDVIRALRGDDRVRGRGGDDLVYGGGGADLLLGDDGADRLAGGSGDDRVAGGDGGDRVWGDAGADRVWGDAGSDAVYGGSGADRVFGGTGDDIVWGDGTTEAAGDGADRLVGGSGDDELYGMGGDDLLDGGSGSDLAFGGTGNDVFRLAPDGRQGGSVDRIDGGAGDDLVRIVLRAQADGGSEAGRFVVRGGAGDDTLDADDDDEAQSGTLDFAGGSGADRVSVWISLNGRIDGGAGDDVVDLGGGTWDVRLGDGNDTFRVGGTYSSYPAGVVRGGSGNDRMSIGTDGNATMDLYGEAGDDVINARYYASGDRIASGGAGDDVVIAGGAWTAIGGSGRDVFGLDLFGTSPQYEPVFPQVPGLIADFESGQDRLAIVRDEWQGPLTWFGLDLLDSDGDGTVTDADDRADVTMVTYGGEERASLVLRLPALGVWEEEPVTTLFGVTSLGAADFLTGGPLPWG